MSAEDARPCLETPTAACLSNAALELFLAQGEPDSALIEAWPGGGGMIAQAISDSRLPMILIETGQRDGYEAFAGRAYRDSPDLDQSLPPRAAIALARMGDAAGALEMIETPRIGRAYRSQWYGALVEAMVALGRADDAKSTYDAWVAFNRQGIGLGALFQRLRGRPVEGDEAVIMAAAEAVASLDPQRGCDAAIRVEDYDAAFLYVQLANGIAQGQFADVELALLACPADPMGMPRLNWLIGPKTPGFGPYDMAPLWRRPHSTGPLRQVLYPDRDGVVAFGPVAQPIGQTPDMLAWANAVWLGHHYAVLQAAMDPAEARALIVDRLSRQSRLGEAAAAWSARVSASVSADDRPALAQLLAARPGGIEDARFRLIAAAIAVYAAQMGDMALLDALLDGAASRPKSPRKSSCGEDFDMGLVLIDARALADRGQIDDAVRTAERVACGDQWPPVMGELAIRTGDQALLRRAVRAAHDLDTPADRMRAFASLADVVATLDGAGGADR
jgi:hypothetical protein